MQLIVNTKFFKMADSRFVALFMKTSGASALIRTNSPRIEAVKKSLPRRQNFYQSADVTEFELAVRSPRSIEIPGERV